MEIEHGYETRWMSHMKRGNNIVAKNIRPLRGGEKMKEKFYNNDICQSCKYARNGVGNVPKRGDTCHCEYYLLTGATCLVKSSDGKITDRRGRLHDKCKLYEKMEDVKC